MAGARSACPGLPFGQPGLQKIGRSCSRSPHQVNGSCKKKEISLALDVIRTGQQTTEGTCSKISEKQKVSKKTNEMTGFMADFTLSSPKGRSPLCSRSSCSRRSSSVSSSDSSYSSSSSISSFSTSWSRSRSRSRSHAKINCFQTSRGYSRSYSRSRSRSHNYGYQERYHLRYYRRHPHSRPRY